MKKLLYIDCIGGISGDMFLAGLLDLGVPLPEIERAVKSLGVKGWKIIPRRARKGVISACRVEVKVEGRQHGRSWGEIKNLISGSKLSKRVRDRSLQIFETLAAAESKIHGEPVAMTHFHEVGALDSIVDVVGAAAGIEYLKVEKIVCSPVPLGRGTISCAHGIIPLPAPATLELLRGMETYGVDIVGETCTPTGAAVLKATAKSANTMPAMKINKIGYGAGSADWPCVPNVLRLVLGDEETSPFSSEEIIIIEANVDDMPPQDFEPMMNAAFESGALDVCLINAQMKKNRPGIMIKALAEMEKLDEIAGIILRHTSTLGVRWYPAQRRVLNRYELVINTSYGKIASKRTEVPGGGIRYTPEYEDLRGAAKKAGVPISEVRRAFWAATEMNCSEKTSRKGRDKRR